MSAMSSTSMSMSLVSSETSLVFPFLMSTYVMMELLRWEICETNAVTKRTAMNREFHTLPLVKPYEVQFRNSGIDITAFTTLLIAGIYYLNLHRRCSPFCEIDMNTEEGRNRIKDAAKSLLRVLYLYRKDFAHHQ